MASLPGALAAVAVCVAWFAGPPAYAQSGGAPAPDPAPDPAPGPLVPDPAPGSGGSEAPAPPPPPPPPTTSPKSTSPNPTSSAPQQSPPPQAAPPTSASSAPQVSTPATAVRSATPVPSESDFSQPAPAPRASQPQPRRAGKRTLDKHKASDTREPRQDQQRSKLARPSPGSVFHASLPLSGLVGGDTDAEPPPVALIALALLTLVLGGAAFLTLTTRLLRMEGLAPPTRPEPRSLQWILQATRFAHRDAARGRGS
jgi:hypothetical protein